MKMKTLFVLLCLGLGWNNARAITAEQILSYFGRQKTMEVFAQQQVDELRAQHWYKYYLSEGKKTLERQLVQSKAFAPVIHAILQEMELPADLFFIAVVESGFMPQALSHKGALGPWQFMPQTARRYGLIVEEGRDERLHLHKSTRAAAHYLKDLYHIFNDWNLAAAAYNAGEFRVLDAIRKGKTRSYKELCLGGYLPEETRNYLAKIWVVKALSERAEEFGLDLTAAAPAAVGRFGVQSMDDWRMITFDRPFPIATMAFMLDRSQQELRHWNADLRSDVIPGDVKNPYAFYIPSDDYRRWQQLIERPFVTRVDDPERLSRFGIGGITRGDKVQMVFERSGMARIHNLSTGESHTLKKFE